MTSGQLAHELEVNRPASVVWQVYGTLKLAQLIDSELKSLVEKVDIVGNGEVGTIVIVKFAPGTPGAAFSTYQEQFTKVDNENRVKETELIKGGYLELGFTLFRVRFEILEKGGDCCSSIIRSTIEYKIKEEDAGNASAVSIGMFAAVAEMVKTYLTKNDQQA